MLVSVRELRAHLSQYLRAVEQGESILVTVRNRPVAMLVPASEGVGVADELARLLDVPGIRWNGGKPQGAQIRLRTGKKLASEMVVEDRR
jgi:prevent-host-death family protein